MRRPEVATPVVTRYEQPWLHDLAVCVDGNVTALSAPSGQIDGSGAQGVFIDDRRILSTLTVLVGGVEAVALSTSGSGAGCDFLGYARHLGDPGADPTVEVHRSRLLGDGAVRETVRVTSRAAKTVVTSLVLRHSGDGAPIASVKAGHAPVSSLPGSADRAHTRWADDWHAVTMTFDPPPATLLAPTAAVPGEATYSIEVQPGGSTTVTIEVSVERLRGSNFDAGPGSSRVSWQDVSVRAADHRLQPCVTSSLDDLQHLLLTDPGDPRDVFAAAGTPWYLTLFGRDSLWAARMMLPLGTELAAGTLRTLARRQGTRVDHERAESPGKIPHEVRRAPYGDPGSHLALPPVYFGTIDATPLWITLLRDAWRWGMAPAEVGALLPQLHAAVRWLTQDSAPDDDGLLKYLDETGSGLANQGWKDSGDSIRWRDGRVAEAPIALVEAQGYAIEAALAAAEIFEAFGQDGAAEAQGWASELEKRVRERFWVRSGEDRYLGIAIDGGGRTVDGVASNMGHLLGTGALEAAEVRSVVGRLTSPEMLGPYGIRTFAGDNHGFNPMGYHTGSIWTHDTAICAWGLAREGYRDEASRVARALLSSSAAFDHRWPELYGGFGETTRPAPYPASCHPQAWSAASAAVLLSVALGFRPDAPAGRLELHPAKPATFGAMTVDGLFFAGRRFGVRTDEDGVTVVDGPADLDIVVV